MLRTWVVAPTRLPAIRRRCHRCASARFRASGKFRVNAHHKLLDVWLLALCTVCEETLKLTVLERVNVRSIRPELLDRLHHNDPVLAAELLQHPTVLRRHRVALDWNNAWRLETGEPDHQNEPGHLDGPDQQDGPGHLTGLDHLDGEAIEVEVRFAARIPVRPTRLIAEGFGLSRAEVGRLIAEGNLVSAVRLNGKLSGGFTFTLKR